MRKTSNKCMHAFIVMTQFTKKDEREAGFCKEGLMMDVAQHQSLSRLAVHCIVLRQ